MRDYDLVLRVNYGLENNVEFITHSAGETHINLNPEITNKKYRKVLVHAHILNSNNLIETISLLNALYYRDIFPDLYIPYCPYSRADRVVGNGGGDSYGINMLKDLLLGYMYKIITLDIHSISSLEMLADSFMVENPIPYDKFIDNLRIRHKIADFCLVSPDAGSRDKVEFFAQKYQVPHFMLQKVRDQTNKGQIVSYKPINPYPNTESAIILDDICDGGRTFIHCSNEIPSPARRFLGVTHGIFSRGLDTLLQAGFEGIITTDSFPQHNNISKKLQVIGVNECL